MTICNSIKTAIKTITTAKAFKIDLVLLLILAFN